MSDSEGIFTGGGGWRTAVRAVLLLGGSLVAVVGVVASTASLVAGLGFGKAGSLKAAVLFGGVLLLAAFLTLFARTATANRSRGLACVGTAVAAVGLALFWTSLPGGWTGHLADLPPIAVGAYATGLLAVFGAGFTADPADDSEAGSERGRRGTDTFGSVESVVVSREDRDDAARSSIVGDGGETENDLTFFDDES
ncbi:DUF7139 domain-containing protein [Halorussus salinisoli]|uniref:DUF7139 domain-containing protein n=1 Tax=Halorussus salinisoli TaxID=2558242 RepID=UPI0010C17E3A|nr:hypothetical protein [Halorussus salinisoli]